MMSVESGEVGRGEGVLSGSFEISGISRSKTVLERVCLLEERKNVGH